MLSNNFKGIEKPQRKEFTPLPEDTYQVQIADITDKTKQNFDGEMAVYLDFEFVILDKAFRGRRLWKDVRPLVVGARAKKASWLYLIIEKALGVEEAQEIEKDSDALDLTKLIGKQIRILVNQTQGRNGNTYNNVVQFIAVKEHLDPFEKGEKPSEQPTEAPRAGSDRETTIKAIFAVSKKLYPTLSAAPEPKDALKEMVERDFSIKVESWSKASTELLNDVYRAMKNEEAKRVTASLNAPDGQPTDGTPTADEINVDDIPF